MASPALTPPALTPSRPRPRRTRLGWLGPAIVMFLAYRAYVQERSRHRSLEFLYDVTRTVHRAPTVPAALTELLTKAREAFHAESAEVYLFPADGGPALRTTVTLAGVTAARALPPAAAGLTSSTSWRLTRFASMPDGRPGRRRTRRARSRAARSPR